jgi:hypothetical protein
VLRMRTSGVAHKAADAGKSFETLMHSGTSRNDVVPFVAAVVLISGFIKEYEHTSSVTPANC